MKQQINNQRPLELFIHIIGWGILFGFPFFFTNKLGSNNINWQEYLRHTMVPLSLLVVFYINYLYLIPNFFFKNLTKRYIIINIFLVIIMSIGLHFWQEINFPSDNAVPPPPMSKVVEELHPGSFPRSNWIFFARDMFSLMLTVVLSLSIKMSSRWTESETALREAEKSKAEAEKSKAEAEKSMTEAELKNLKDQLNPHFLLNTLNNIYALIAFSPEKAQQAVQDLSKLLRYVLYDNNQTYVSLRKEVEFMQNYIELMKIRLSDNIKIDVKMHTLNGTDTKVAPLLFISLIENAFKHGVSYSIPSFINISLEEQLDGSIVCHIENSFFPKSEHDKSGSGIGLESLQKRLELLYPGHYKWEKGIKGNMYISDLVISNNANVTTK